MAGSTVPDPRIATGRMRAELLAPSGAEYEFDQAD
jgi:hypothetical protein